MTEEATFALVMAFASVVGVVVAYGLHLNRLQAAEIVEQYRVAERAERDRVFWELARRTAESFDRLNETPDPAPPPHTFSESAVLLAKAVLDGDHTAAMGLADEVFEHANRSNGE